MSDIVSDISSPPPPPPPMPEAPKSQKLCLKNNINSISAADGLHKAGPELATLIEIELKKLDQKYTVAFQHFRPVPFQLQEGPTCGMVALSMALGNDKYHFKRLMEMAASHNWSYNGEMFSCEWMSHLGIEAGANCTCLKGGLYNNIQTISDCLLGGGFVLVPYDKDKNHSPGLFEGTQAHWAVLTGLVLMVTNSSLHEENTSSWKLVHRPGIGHSVQLINDRLQLRPSDDDDDETALLYVCAFQGLSQHVQLWPFNKLAESNGNLSIVDSKRAGLVRLPECGDASELRDQLVLIKGF